MCGIWGIFGTDCEVFKYISCFFEIKHRGLDCFRFENMKRFENIGLGFHRLAFHDPITGMQPMQLLSIPHVTMIYNGEIYNFQELKEKYNFNFETACDGEALIHMYNMGGIKFMLENLYGVFGFILLDKTQNKVYIGRDTFGVRPLYRTYSDEKGTLAVCSEAKGIIGVDLGAKIELVDPGTYEEYDLVYSETLKRKTCKYIESFRYHTIGDFPKYDMQIKLTDDISENIRNSFRNAVGKRVFGERKIGCLLSGGLGSSLVCGILVEELKKVEESYPLLTFSIGMGIESHDLVAARTVSKFLKTEHHEVIIDKNDAVDSIREVIRITESYDKTTIRDAIVMYLLSKYIKEKTDVRCIMSGDGNDEVLQGYKSFYTAPSAEAAHQESLRLCKNLHLYDLVRADHTTASNGLELRTPFLDHFFSAYYLSLPCEKRMPTNNRLEKHLMRKAFNGLNVIPQEIIWKPKQDIVDGIATDLFLPSVLRKHAADKVTDEELANASQKFPHATPTSKEGYYYRKIFTEFYPNCDNLVPYKWQTKK